MSLLETVQQDLILAMKGQDKVRLGSLRMLKSALKNAEIEAMGEIDEAVEVQVVRRMAKQRRESIEMFEKNNRQELADNEKAELVVIEAYLPQAVPEEEIDAAIEQVVQATGATGAKMIGQVTGQVMKALAGKPVDGKVVSAKVKIRLGA
jgi:uncharacterized protein YqeY